MARWRRKISLEAFAAAARKSEMLPTTPTPTPQGRRNQKGREVKWKCLYAHKYLCVLVCVCVRAWKNVGENSVALCEWKRNERAGSRNRNGKSYCPRECVLLCFDSFFSFEKKNNVALHAKNLSRQSIQKIMFMSLRVCVHI